MSIRSSVARRARVLTAVLVLAACTGALGTAAAGGADPTTYYVAMGDSLGAGVGASQGASSYVQLVYQHELARMPGLQLENFSCSGATSGSVINGPSCGSVTQLAQTKAFLQAHSGQIAFLTIDIGGNDVDGCTGANGIDTTCIANGLAAVNTNIPKILSALEAADPGIRVLGMNYYDPFLAAWLTGASGETQAQQSVTQADAFNTILTHLYNSAGFRIADVATAFQTDDFSLTGTYNSQTLPQNVANACNWTHMCDISDFHANDAGHAVLAQSFEAAIDAPAAPGAPTAISASPGNGGATLRWTAPAHRGSSPLTGYVVTPYIGTTAQAARVFNTLATAEPIGGLTNGTTYSFRIAATNAVGTGAMSTAAGVVVGAPSVPNAPAATPGSASAAIRWTAPTLTNGSPITGYAISAFKGATLVKTVPVGAVTHATATGLTNGATYTFTITAKNARGAGHSATTAPIVVGAPGIPTGVVATAGMGRATVRWTPPANNGAAITGYIVTPFVAGVAQPARTFNSTAATQSITGLSATHVYSFRVAARNARGTGPPSLASNAVRPS